MKLIDKDDLVVEIEKEKKICKSIAEYAAAKYAQGRLDEIKKVVSIINSLEVKEVDIDKLCEFRKDIGFAYPESASEYQKQLACYRQGIKDVIKAQKGE